jgi:hypothetical protein
VLVVFVDIRIELRALRQLGNSRHHLPTREDGRLSCFSPNIKSSRHFPLDNPLAGLRAAPFIQIHCISMPSCTPHPQNKENSKSLTWRKKFRSLKNQYIAFAVGSPSTPQEEI